MRVKRYNYNEDPNYDVMLVESDGPYVSWEDYKWMSDYADRLVQHKDMVCLPMDMENLRNANARLAEENNSLKEEIKELEEKSLAHKARIMRLRQEIKNIRAITELKGCICKRKFVKLIPSLIFNESLIIKPKED